MKMLFVYTIIYSCFPQGKRVPQKAPYLMSVSATKQVLLLPPSINKELAACKYSYGILHVVVVSKFAADDLNSGWLYESFQERQCTSLAIGLFLLHNWIKWLLVAVELACSLNWTNLSMTSQHSESLLIFPFDFWWKSHGLF